MNLRRWFSNYQVIPEYAVVGLSEPQRQIRVELHGLGEPLDVTYNHTIVSMRPFTISIGWHYDQEPSEIRPTQLSLLFIDNGSSNRILGRIVLRFADLIDLEGSRVGLFHAAGHKNKCLPWTALQLYLMRRAFINLKNKTPFNFRMKLSDLHSLYVFYICPRPIVLVSVSGGGMSNIFPMDLIGPVDGSFFLMALRNTSPAVRLMEKSERMALSSMPLEYKDIVYELGKHHRKETIDLTTLPFETMTSTEFHLPVPRPSLVVREARVRKSYVVGSHTLFVTTIVSQQTFSSKPSMHHIHGTYHQYLRVKGECPL